MKTQGQDWGQSQTISQIQQMPAVGSDSLCVSFPDRQSVAETFSHRVAYSVAESISIASQQQSTGCFYSMLPIDFDNIRLQTVRSLPEYSTMGRTRSVDLTRRPSRAHPPRASGTVSLQSPFISTLSFLALFWLLIYQKSHRLLYV